MLGLGQHPARKWCWMLPSGLLLALLQLSQATAGTVYRFSPDNEFGINVMATHWNPIVAYLSEKTGLQIRLKIGRSLADTNEYAVAQATDLVFTAEMDDARTAPLREWTPFAVRRSGAQHVEIITNPGSRLGLSDLTGKSVAFASPGSAVFRQVQAELTRRGIDIRPVFTGNPDAAHIHLITRNVSAAAVTSSATRSFEARSAQATKVLWRSSPLPEMVFLASPQVHARDVAAIRDALAAMSADHAGGRQLIESAARAAGFSPGMSFLPLRSAPVVALTKAAPN